MADDRLQVSALLKQYEKLTKWDGVGGTARQARRYDPRHAEGILTRIDESLFSRRKT